MSNPENFFDSDELMSWLLLNPELVDWDIDAHFNNNNSSGFTIPSISESQSNNTQILGNQPNYGSLPSLPNNQQFPWQMQNGNYRNQPISGNYSNQQLHVQPMIAPKAKVAIKSENIVNNSSMMDPLWANPSQGNYSTTSNNIKLEPKLRHVSSINSMQSVSKADDKKGKLKHSASNNRVDSLNVMPNFHMPNISNSNIYASTNSLNGSINNAKATVKKRPRESIEDIESRVKELRVENADLQSHLLTVTQRTTEVQRQRTSMERMMAAKVAGMDKNVDDPELAELVEKYTEIYADYGKCRQREVAFHLHQLEKLILPTKTTKMCLWTLQQDESFYQKNKSPMYDILSKELDLTTEQVQKIQDRRERIGGLLGQLKESLNLIESLKTSIANKHEAYDGICGRVQEAVTPRQTVLFQLWINQNADKLAKFLPDFNRSAHHLSSAEFTDETLITNPSAYNPLISTFQYTTEGESSFFGNYGGNVGNVSSNSQNTFDDTILSMNNNQNMGGRSTIDLSHQKL
eukprot:gene7984-10827_t